MTKRTHRMGTRLTALTLSLLFTAGCMVPSFAAEPIGNGVHPTYDEAYYATLDYYGNLMQGSVVKSYIMNGASSLTDFGVYDEVVNLTDGTAPTRGEGSTTFQFQADSAPSHFYFEGKTAAPFAALPWTISVSYTLNGVPTKAEDLAGKTGVVEILVDAIPNENASEYARYNYTLEAMAVFNQDDILSLEAPGAQVQLIGNLRAVLFVALPGEEQHFVIRVGSEDFSFGGMSFLLVPATLSQLDEIAKLGERKDDLEEDYRKLSGSMDTLLASFSSLGSSLRETAKGLDQLNEARDTVSEGKGQLYEQADKALADLAALNGTLETLPPHLDSTDQAITDVTGSLTTVTDTTVAIQKHLKDLSACLDDIRDDLQDIHSNSGDMEANLDRLAADLTRLEQRLAKVESALEELRLEINGQILDSLPPEITDHVTVQGTTMTEVLASAKKLEQLWSQLAGKHASIHFDQFVVAAMLASGTAASPQDAQGKMQAYQQLAQGIEQFRQSDPQYANLSDQEILTFMAQAGQITADQAEAYLKMQGMLELLTMLYTDLCGGPAAPMNQEQFYTAMLILNDLGDHPENLPVLLQSKGAYRKTAQMLIALRGRHNTAHLSGLVGDLKTLLGHMGQNGLTEELSKLVEVMDSAIDHLDDTTGVVNVILGRVDKILTEVKNLDDTVNQHVPGFHDTITDTKQTITDLSALTTDTHALLTTFRDLAQKSGGQLDAGTKQTLTNLAETLRRTARSTDAVGGVKSAKDAMSEIIEDTWNEVTGETNNLLMMDSKAAAQSLTSDQNPTPSSIQVLIRTQEIKVEDAAKRTADPDAPEQTTFWGRVTQMFRDLWNAITGIFR